MQSGFKKGFLAGLFFIASSSTFAATLDLGIAGDFNVFAFNNFTSHGSDVEGAVAAGNNVTASSYSINVNNKSYNGYSLVVGNNLSYNNASISNGNVYAGGAVNTSDFGFSGSFTSGASPVSFGSVKSSMTSLSNALSDLTANGNTAIQYGGITFTGSGTSDVQIFNVSGADLASVNNANFANLSTGQSIIVNISGLTGSLQGGTPLGFANYNTLFNFYEASTLSFNNVGIFGSILAPNATVVGTSAQINGNVIVNNWDSSIQVNSNHYFADVNVPGLVIAVPEPQTYAMMLSGLGLLAFASYRRRASQV